MDDGAKASNNRAEEVTAVVDDAPHASGSAVAPEDLFADEYATVEMASPGDGSRPVLDAPFASRVSLSAAQGANGPRRAFTAYAASVAAMRGGYRHTAFGGETNARGGAYPRLWAQAGRLARRSIEGARQARSRWLPAAGTGARRRATSDDVAPHEAIVDEVPIWQIIDPEDHEGPRLDGPKPSEDTAAAGRRATPVIALGVEEAHAEFACDAAIAPAVGATANAQTNLAEASERPDRGPVFADGPFDDGHFVEDRRAETFPPDGGAQARRRAVGGFAWFWKRTVLFRVGMATAVFAATALVVASPTDPWGVGVDNLGNGRFSGAPGAPPASLQEPDQIALAPSPSTSEDEGRLTEGDVFAHAALRRAALEAVRWEARRQGVAGAPRSVSLGASYGAEGFFFGDVVFEERRGFCTYRRVAFQRAPGAPLDAIAVLQIGQPTLGACAAPAADAANAPGSAARPIAYSDDPGAAAGLPAAVRAAAADATLVSEDGYLTEASLRAMLTILPVRCLPSRLVEDACLETVRYDATAFLFTAITPIAEGAQLEIDGAYTIRNGGICHETRGISALVTGGAMSDPEVFAYERLAEADYAAVRGGAICYRLRPAPGAPGVFFGDAFVDGEPAPDWRDPRPFEMRRG